MWRLALLLALIAAPVAASQRPAADIAAICDEAARIGASASEAPLEILRALTRTETGRRLDGAFRPWPWTVNMEGEGFWFETREEALAFVRARRAAGARSFDIGCFQINFRWHGGAFESIEAMFDPALNARYAAKFLDELKSEGAAGALRSAAIIPEHPNSRGATPTVSRRSWLRSPPFRPRPPSPAAGSRSVVTPGRRFSRAARPERPAASLSPRPRMANRPARAPIGAAGSRSMSSPPAPGSCARSGRFSIRS